MNDVMKVEKYISEPSLLDGSKRKEVLKITKSVSELVLTTEKGVEDVIDFLEYLAEEYQMILVNFFMDLEKLRFKALAEASRKSDTVNKALREVGKMKFSDWKKRRNFSED